MSLLIIEDDEPFVELMLLALKPSKYRVARSIPEAFKLIEDDAPEVIVLDLKLPGSLPEDTVGQIRELRARSKDATIIVITGHPDFRRLQDAAVSQGAKSVLSKDTGGLFGTLSEEILRSGKLGTPTENAVVKEIEDTVIKIVGGGSGI